MDAFVAWIWRIVLLTTTSYSYRWPSCVLQKNYLRWSVQNRQISRKFLFFVYENCIKITWENAKINMGSRTFIRLTSLSILLKSVPKYSEHIGEKFWKPSCLFTFMLFSQLLVRRIFQKVDMLFNKQRFGITICNDIRFWKIPIILIITN